jgi:aminobenzoyl-glutamate utilization protein B
MLNTTCWPTNAPAHSWGVVATGGMSIGHKGMMYAAQVMALSAAHLIENPEKLAAARAEFKQKTSSTAYICPVSDDVMPPQNPNPYRIKE